MAFDDRCGPERLADVTRRAADHGLLRAALELAVVVARAGADGRPPIPPPSAFRPFLRHAKWTSRTMATVREVLDSDEAFRIRVKEAAERLDDDALGRPSWLWLGRPEGWQEELAHLVADIEETAAHKEDEKDERLARRQVAGLRAELERARAAAARAEQQADGSDADLTEQRRQRREAEATVAQLQSSLNEALITAESLRRQAEDAHSTAARAREDLERAQAEAATLRRQADLMAARIATLDTEVAAAETGRRRGQQADEELARTVADAVAQAAAAAQALGAALGSAARNLGHRDESAHLDQGAPAEQPTVAPRRSVAPRAPQERQRNQVGHAQARPRRRPMSLPPAVFEDSPEAAAYLVRSGVLLVVDGYNVSLFAWPGLDLARQRQRITEALAELAARSGAVIHVVFDGHEVHALPPVRGAPRASVRVGFSDPGVDADEVIIDLVEGLPPERSVVVATNDRRVQDEVRRRGANVVSTPQLLGLLRRGGHTLGPG